MPEKTTLLIFSMTCWESILELVFVQVDDIFFRGRSDIVFGMARKGELFGNDEGKFCIQCFSHLVSCFDRTGALRVADDAGNAI